MPSKSTETSPRDIGLNVLPNFNVFGRLLSHASVYTDVVVNDVTNGYGATHIQLLTDLLHVRNIVYRSLNEQARQKLMRGEEVFINLICPAGYEFAVGFLAILALGAVVVPLAPSIPVHEGLYFVQTSTSDAILTAASCSKLGHDLAKSARASNPLFFCVDLKPLICKPPLRIDQITMSSDWFLDYFGAGVVIFTSGTTGPPKGAVRSRSFLDAMAQRTADHYGLHRGDVVMHTLPVHHTTGIGTTFMPFIISGAGVEFNSGGFDPQRVWERWRKGGLTFFSGVPTMYMRLMRYYENVIIKMPLHKQKEYVDGAQRFRSLLCGTAALPHSLQQKWQELRNGRRILERYGSTESSTVFTVNPDDLECPDGSAGKKVAGVDVRLSEGDQGEILIRSPYLFTKYLHNPDATAASFDEDGYYRSGDIGRREGDYYFIMGRASVDILKSGGYKISALDVEREIIALEYVSEVMVCGVEDDDFGQRVAAAIVLKDENNASHLILDHLRADLRARLAGYKLPTLLRVISELPKTASGKVMKKALKGQLFPPGGHPDVQVWKSKEMKAHL